MPQPLPQPSRHGYSNETQFTPFGEKVRSSSNGLNIGETRNVTRHPFQGSPPVALEQAEQASPRCPLEDLARERARRGDPLEAPEHRARQHERFGGSSAAVAPADVLGDPGLVVQ